MDAVIVAELHAIAEDARAQEASARRLAERTERLLASLRKQSDDSPESDLKRPDGRLTEAGVAAVNASFDAGATVTQVAKQFGIHVSAASNRRTIWKARKASGSS